ncbi:MAG: YpdA family putative bacillithiol disulfide reductase [Vicinamibacterales bacterium]
MSTRDVAIIGAGPAGLATAIAAKRAGLSYVVLEKGVLVNSLFHFPTNMVYFTTPELLEIGGIPFMTPYEKPTRVEALRYYRKVVDYFDLDVQTEEEVVRVCRDHAPDGVGGLSLETLTSRGVRRTHHARDVVLAAGAYDKPNLLGVPGEALPHVSHYYSEAHAFYRKRVVIVGGKNSAAEAALELFRSGVHVTLVHRRERLGESIKYWVLPDIENRIKEGSIAALFNTTVTEIHPTSVVVDHAGRQHELAADAVLLMTGYHSDTSLFDRCGVEYDPATFEPRFDAQTLETNVKGIYAVGSVQTGRNSGRIFIENGRFHGEHVIGVIAERARERASI